MISLDQLRSVHKKLMKNADPINVVQDERQAEEFTKHDPVGHIWNVGDKFYIVEIE